MKCNQIFYKYPVWLLLFLIFLLLSCSKNPKPEIIADKSIVSFVIIKANGVLLDTATTSVLISGDSINILVPPGTDLTNLTPVIVIKGVSVSPASGISQNFTQPVVYTVTGSDGTTHIYVVSVQWSQLHNVVYFGTSGNFFYALDAETGAVVWVEHGNGGFSYSSPTIRNNTVYAGNTDGNLYAFDATTGLLLWTFAAAAPIESSPAVADNIVYFGSDDDYFYAVNATNGQLVWKYKTGYNVSSSPSVVNGVVYVGSDDDNLYAFNAANGEVKWKFTAGALFNSSSPLVDKGAVFIGNRDGYLYAIDSATGSLKWKYYSGGVSLEMSSPAVSGGIVYIGGWYVIGNSSQAGSLYAVDEETGGNVWTSLNNLGIGSNPAIDSGSLYITADDLNLYSISAATGSVNWKAQIIPNGASPAVADKTVYVGGGGNGYFYALDAATGSIKWKFIIGQNALMVSSPCIIGSDGKIYHSRASGEAH